MNGNSLARQFAGTGKVQRKSAAKGAAKSAVKNKAKNAERNSTAETQQFGIFHDCLHFSLGTCWQPAFSTPFRGDLAMSQALPQHGATHCRT